MTNDPRLPDRIVLLDGVRGFCNASGNLIVRHDRRDLYRFAPLGVFGGNGFNTLFLDSRSLTGLFLFTHLVKKTNNCRSEIFNGTVDLLTVLTRA